MKNNIRNIASLLVLLAFLWVGLASNKDEEIFTVRATIEFEEDAMIVTNTDAFSFNEYSLSLVLPGGVGDEDAKYNFYTVNLPIPAGSSQEIKFSNFTNFNNESYPNAVKPETASLNVWTNGQVGVLEVSL